MQSWNSLKIKNKKIFQGGNHILSLGVLGGWYTYTPLQQHYNAPYLNTERSRFCRLYFACENTFICVFKVLFTGLYAFIV